MEKNILKDSFNYKRQEYDEKTVKSMKDSFLSKIINLELLDKNNLKHKPDSNENNNINYSDCKSSYNFDNYDVICLDVDHTLAIYNNENLSELMFWSFVEFLVEKKEYPDIRNSEFPFFRFLFENKNSFYSLDIILDKCQGTCLKINHDKTIVKAYYGIHLLDKKEIEKIYPSNKYEFFDNNVKSNDKYAWISGWYDYHIVSIYLFYVELVKILKIKRLIANQITSITSDKNLCISETVPKEDIEYYENFKKTHNLKSDNDFLVMEFLKNNPNKNIQTTNEIEDSNLLLNNLPSYSQIFTDILESLYFNFFHYDMKTNEQFACINCGYFFPKFFETPEKYLCKKFDSLRFITSLKNKGKHVVIITNSAYEFSDLVMKNTAGDNYLDYCDIMVYFSKKPVFFNSINSNQPTSYNKWYYLDTTKKDHIGKEIDFISKNMEEKKQLCKELSEIKSTIFGNYQQLEEFFKIKLNKDNIKILMVGDSMFSDSLQSNRLKDWQSVYILSSLEEKSFNRISIPKNFGDKWGKYFNFCDEINKSLKDNLDVINISSLDKNDYNENKKELSEKRVSHNITINLLKEEGILVLPHAEYIDYFTS